MAFGVNVASLMAKRMKDLIQGRKQRDMAVNNTRQGFTQPDEVDKKAYARKSGRRC